MQNAELSVSEFSKNWLFASILKQSLGAAFYEIKPLTSRFNSGRLKYLCVFFNEDNKIISQNLAMELTSKKTKRDYFVISVTAYVAPSTDEIGGKKFRENILKEIIENGGL
jgi:hypothetical protein